MVNQATNQATRGRPACKWGGQNLNRGLGPVGPILGPIMVHALGPIFGKEPLSDREGWVKRGLKYLSIRRPSATSEHLNLALILGP